MFCHSAGIKLSFHHSAIRPPPLQHLNWGCLAISNLTLQLLLLTSQVIPTLTSNPHQYPQCACKIIAVTGKCDTTLKNASTYAIICNTTKEQNVQMRPLKNCHSQPTSSRVPTSYQPTSGYQLPGGFLLPLLRRIYVSLYTCPFICKVYFTVSHSFMVKI